MKTLFICHLILILSLFSYTHAEEEPVYVEGIMLKHVSGNKYIITVVGDLPTPGYGKARLVPRTYIAAPKNWEIDVVAAVPKGNMMSIAMLSPFKVSLEYTFSKSTAGITVVGRTKQITKKLEKKQFIEFPGTNSITVTYAPKANFSAKDVKTKQIHNSNTTKKWLKVLGKIPSAGPGIHAKMSGTAPEYKIEFFKSRLLLGTLRIKGGSLDAPVGPGWDFYSGDTDKAFVALVKNAVK